MKYSIFLVVLFTSINGMEHFKQALKKITGDDTEEIKHYNLSKDIVLEFNKDKCFQISRRPLNKKCEWKCTNIISENKCVVLKGKEFSSTTSLSPIFYETINFEAQKLGTAFLFLQQYEKEKIIEEQNIKVTIK